MSHGGFIAGSCSGVHDRVAGDGDRNMIDVVYIVLTMAFFLLMLAYVRGCERLGRDATGEEERP